MSENDEKRYDGRKRLEDTYLKNRDNLVNYAARIIYGKSRASIDKSSAEDIVQQSFYELLLTGGIPEKVNNAKMYILKVVHNQTGDWINKEKSRKTLLKKLGQRKEMELKRKIGERPDKTEYQDILKLVPARGRGILEMKLEGKEIEEIIEELGITRTAIYWRLNYDLEIAKERLKRRGYAA